MKEFPSAPTTGLGILGVDLQWTDHGRHIQDDQGVKVANGESQSERGE